ncbi:hypothetical protein GGTG_00578 [Gaeumannomyces tritici R3-111a-1]|uniref:Uncharacterized protein n=1 Tax=Gaeumannomyces tritici (strain R3-111a-1) TaxID=644352 RepID=J3NH40_GAET3|nr:hypothetical protein GGTG_00578 [Gaeumannomyces tritici R3-111a-1]EJT80583.1 hypothetical protein GGTG_00578 [Gaeumannomyces tritici R3-111a-1]
MGQRREGRGEGGKKRERERARESNRPRDRGRKTTGPANQVNSRCASKQACQGDGGEPTRKQADDKMRSQVDEWAPGWRGDDGREKHARRPRLSSPPTTVLAVLARRGSLASRQCPASACPLLGSFVGCGPWCTREIT